MQERQKIISEYFDLIVRLNRTNKLSNTATELTFEIIQNSSGVFQFRATLKGANVSMLLAERARIFGWQALGFSGYEFLENFIATLLDEIQHNLQIENIDTITMLQKTLIVDFIKEKLSNLGVPNDLL